jgi:hypothetical protein
MGMLSNCFLLADGKNKSRLTNAFIVNNEQKPKLPVDHLSRTERLAVRIVLVRRIIDGGECGRLGFEQKHRKANQDL